MKYTLLDLTQKILSALDANNIDTLEDGDVEAEQVVMIINRVYNEILSKRNWPFLKKRGTLIPGENPWELKVPEYYTTISELRYKTSKIKYVDNTTFSDIIFSRNIEEDNINSNYIQTDKDPSFYTTYDNITLVFDSYDSNVESNLIESNSYIVYNKLPSSELFYDNDVPELPYRFHSVLLNGALAVAFTELKQDNVNSQMKYQVYKSGMSDMTRWASSIEDTKPSIFNNSFGIRSI